MRRSTPRTFQRSRGFTTTCGTCFVKIGRGPSPPHHLYNCAIDLLPSALLPSSRLYSLTRSERDAMERYITESLAAGLICPSSSPVAAGFFFVAKKDTSLRLCIDYRGLNRITVKNKYPLPLLSSTFELLQGMTVFSKLDLRNAYHLVRISERDEWKTAFNTHLGHFEYLMMPFGLTNAPAVFQAMVNDVLCDFVNRCVFVYLDDMLTFSKMLAEYQVYVRQVLKRLLENRLFVKGKKCEFQVTSVAFLGYIIERGNLRTDPPNRRQLQRFWDLQTFTGNSFVISVESLSHSLNLLLPKFLSSGIPLRSMPSPCPGEVFYSAHSLSTGPHPAVYCGGGCIGLRSGSGPVPAGGW